MAKNTPIATLTCTDNTLAGERIDKFLHQALPGYSRSYFQDLIAQGHVQVNEKALQKSNYTIKLADTVIVTLKTKEWNFAPTPVDFTVVDEQPDFVVINKPAGLLVHHTATDPEAVTLINGLLHRYPEMHGFDSPERPGIVHRIDKNTSGLLLVARTLQAQHAFAALFKERAIEKTYLAVVDGVTPTAGRIDFPIGRHSTERHKMSVVGLESRPALSLYTRQEAFAKASLLAVRIVTGRTHQIRVHCAAIGHGLLGDEIYGIATPLIGRQALHAWQMAFTYQGKRFTYEAPLPDDMGRLLEDLRSQK
ncbi:RluA family pseudouridine synthase [bacterium]|nr:RluA family pseudouridine synthase [bacterium]